MWGRGHSPGIVTPAGCGPTQPWPQQRLLFEQGLRAQSRESYWWADCPAIVVSHHPQLVMGSTPAAAAAVLHDPSHVGQAMYLALCAIPMNVVMALLCVRLLSPAGQILFFPRFDCLRFI